ncbi:hypothetical protein OIU76_026574 [Salix suchowensis]|nr:hypothetical protein OIU76_026574 [Salix suchowensis]
MLLFSPLRDRAWRSYLEGARGYGGERGGLLAASGTLAAGALEQQRVRRRGVGGGRRARVRGAQDAPPGDNTRRRGRARVRGAAAEGRNRGGRVAAEQGGTRARLGALFERGWMETEAARGRLCGGWFGLFWWRAGRGGLG